MAVWQALPAFFPNKWHTRGEDNPRGLVILRNTSTNSLTSTSKRGKGKACITPTDASHLPSEPASLHLSQSLPSPRLHETWLRGPGRCGAVRCTYLRTDLKGKRERPGRQHEKICRTSQSPACAGQVGQRWPSTLPPRKQTARRRPGVKFPAR